MNRARTALALAAVAALVAWFWSRGEQFIAANGQTFDEGVHLAAGYSYWSTGNFRSNAEDPPLFKLLWAAPLAATGSPPYPSGVTSPTSNHWHVATRYSMSRAFPRERCSTRARA